MGGALHRIALRILNALHLHLDIPSVRLHDLNPVTCTEFIALFNLSQSIFRHAADDAQLNIFPHIGAVVIDLRLFRRLSEIEARGELSVGAFSDLFLIPVSYTHLDVYKRQG